MDNVGLNLQEKSNKNRVKFFVIFLFLIIICFAGYTVYDKVLSTNNNNNNNNSNNINGENSEDVNENLIINLTEAENKRVLDIFYKLIIWNMESEEGEELTYFTTDLSRARAVFFSNSTITKTVEEYDAGSGRVTCYKFDELNALSIKVFGQGINLNVVKDSFYSAHCPSGYIGYDGGTVLIPTKINELRYNEKTKVYTLEIIEDDSSDLSAEYKNMFYEFQFKINDDINLTNLKFEDLINLSGKKLDNL